MTGNTREGGEIRTDKSKVENVDERRIGTKPETGLRSLGRIEIHSPKAQNK